MRLVSKEFFTFCYWKLLVLGNQANNTSLDMVSNIQYDSLNTYSLF
jgi:hypothetical protein